MLSPPPLSLYRNHLLFFLLFSQNLFLSVPAETHQVFVNFRGEDLRFNFVSHLTDAFERHGITFFIDEHEYRGKNLDNLFVRIEEARIAIALFSPRYSESRWCLDELVKMKRLADKEKLTVIPVFYKVKAEDVKHLKGEFGENFFKLAMTHPDCMREWKDALECVCSYMGMSLADKSSEADFVKDIVKEVQRVLEAITPKEDEKIPHKEEEKIPHKEKEIRRFDHFWDYIAGVMVLIGFLRLISHF
uniref:TIR domain-containing protein n=1 Tax=Brassica oleracea TaxID=3712 RepID=A0A3P6H0L3_BRAOL|nr:unnamed protein product [Brassica oleracea]